MHDVPGRLLLHFRRFDIVNFLLVHRRLLQRVNFLIMPFVWVGTVFRCDGQRLLGMLRFNVPAIGRPRILPWLPSGEVLRNDGPCGSHRHVLSGAIRSRFV